MTTNTVHIIYTKAIASELPQLYFEATKTLDLRENLDEVPGESYQTRGHLCNYGNEVTALRMRRVVTRIRISVLPLGGYSMNFEL